MQVDALAVKPCSLPNASSQRIQVSSGLWNVDSCSSDNYVLNSTARKMKLRWTEEVDLEIEGMGQVVTNLEKVKVYVVPVQDKDGKLGWKTKLSEVFRFVPKV